MIFRELEIAGAWIIQSNIHTDNRGFFLEWYKQSEFKENTGIDFSIAQANHSKSAKGVLRGIHYSLASKGQAKWVTCTSGRIWDVVIDIRPNSPTFKNWIAIDIAAESGTSLFLNGNLGHAFVALEDNTKVSYLVDSEYAPSFELDLNPLDPEIKIEWPNLELFMSEKDANSPYLTTRINEGKLPNAS